ncbi:MAG: phosphodiester glycosidase family protein [Oligoflexales bacterium]|nr:phosphodiester glycosidase family protein [Oligoflexales bacterium]
MINIFSPQILLLFLFSLQFAFASMAVSRNKWTPIFQGIEYLFDEKVQDHGKLRIHVIRVAIENASINLFTDLNKRQENIKVKSSGFLQKFDAQIAISGPQIMKESTKYFGAEINLQSVVRSIRAIQDNPRPGVSVEDKTAEVIVLVHKGVAIDYTDNERIARSAVGLSEDGKSMFFVIVEGGPRHGFFFKDLISIGVSPGEFGEILIDRGIYTALQLNTNRFPVVTVKSDREGGAHTLSLAIDKRDDDELEMQSHWGLKALPLAESNEPFLEAFVKEKNKVRNYRNSLRNYGLASPVQFQEMTPCFNLEDQCPKTGLKGLSDLALSLKDLKQVDRKYYGEASGGIFRDHSQVVWIVKVGFQPVNEYIGGRILHTFYPDQTPLVTFVLNNEEGNELIKRELDKSAADRLEQELKDPAEASQRISLLSKRKLMLASQQLIGFEPASFFEPPIDRIEKAAELKIAMDWIGLGDRSVNNQGYISKNGKYLAARVDFDNAFDLAKGWFNWENPDLDMSRQLLKDIELFSFAELERAIHRLVSIPDKVIVNLVETVCEDLRNFDRTDYCSQAPFMGSDNLAKVLIRRKHAAKSFDLSAQYFSRHVGVGIKTKAHILKIDPRKKSIVIEATESFERPETTAEISRRKNAVAAINGGFWNYGPAARFASLKGVATLLGVHALTRNLGLGNVYAAYPEGTLITDSKTYKINSGSSSIGWTRSGMIGVFGSEHFNLKDAYSGIFVPYNNKKTVECISDSMKDKQCLYNEIYLKEEQFYQMEFVLAVDPILVLNGKKQGGLDSLTHIRGGQAVSRSGICVSRGDDWNLVAVEKATLDFFAEVMIGLKCEIAVNLDGSGSTSMIFRGTEIFSANKVPVLGRPVPRQVSDAILVLDKEN